MTNTPIQGSQVETIIAEEDGLGDAVPARALASGRARAGLVGFAASIAIALSGCQQPPKTATADQVQALKDGEVALVATAPDGTKLWAVSADRIVYFSSSGTQTSHTEACGRDCTRTVDDVVPAQGTEARSDETACRLGPKGNGPVPEGEAP